MQTKHTLIIQTAIIDESDFDPTIWQRAQIKNNSGYLDE